VDLSTTVLGQSITMPIGIAPSGKHKLAHPDGELATARGEKSGRKVNFGLYLYM